MMDKTENKNTDVYAMLLKKQKSKLQTRKLHGIIVRYSRCLPESLILVSDRLSLFTTVEESAG